MVAPRRRIVDRDLKSGADQILPDTHFVRLLLLNDGMLRLYERYKVEREMRQISTQEVIGPSDLYPIDEPVSNCGTRRRLMSLIGSPSSCQRIHG